MGAIPLLVAAVANEGDTAGGREGNGSTAEYSDDLWEEFWCVYPRHEAKKDARKAWRDVPPATRLQAIVAAVDWRRVWKRQGRDTSVIPLPATWLRGERWEDELPEWYHPPKENVVVPINGEEHNQPPVQMPQYVRDQIALMKRSR